MYGCDATSGRFSPHTHNHRRNDGNGTIKKNTRFNAEKLPIVIHSLSLCANVSNLFENATEAKQKSTSNNNNKKHEKFEFEFKLLRIYIIESFSKSDNNQRIRTSHTHRQ